MQRSFIVGTATLAAALLVSQAQAAPPSSYFKYLGLNADNFAQYLAPAPFKEQVFQNLADGRYTVTDVGDMRLSGNDYYHTVALPVPSLRITRPAGWMKPDHGGDELSAASTENGGLDPSTVKLLAWMAYQFAGESGEVITDRTGKPIPVSR